MDTSLLKFKLRMTGAAMSKLTCFEILKLNETLQLTMGHNSYYQFWVQPNIEHNSFNAIVYSSRTEITTVKVLVCELFML